MRRGLSLMSCRRQRDEWDDFRKRHRDARLGCDVPDHIFADTRRILMFLDHGYDEWIRTRF